MRLNIRRIVFLTFFIANSRGVCIKCGIATIQGGSRKRWRGSKICIVRAFDLIPTAFNRSRNFKTTGTIVAAPEADMTT